MKIERKLILSNVFNLSVILLIGFFAFQNMNLVLTKLRFVEIADDLNASFLEMRLSEKNFFLYKDKNALREIRGKIDSTIQSINLVRGDIEKAIGRDDLAKLESSLKHYSGIVEGAGSAGLSDPQLENRLRASGKTLKEFSDSITHLERKRVNELISGSMKFLFYSFLIIFASAILVSHYISQKIVRSLRSIEKLAKSISGGDFSTIEEIRTHDELASVITAINSMSEELKNREEQLIQSKKLASLGVLTAGVAHELNNPLNNISMIAQTYAEVYDSLGREDRIGFMSKIEKETERIRDIVRDLLDFSKPKEANLKETNINTIITKTFHLVQNMLHVSNVEATLTLADQLPPVFVDERQIQQVLVNLITNAAQAMRPGDKLCIASSHGQHSVRVSVKDTGKGIAPEFLPHVFDPFFSTKGEGGAGLGLSVSYGIIKNHKGDIHVESKPNRGTTFTIELPIYDNQEEADVTKNNDHR